MHASQGGEFLDLSSGRIALRNAHPELVYLDFIFYRVAVYVDEGVWFRIWFRVWFILV